MDDTYWLKQAGVPLYPEIEWNKPERRDQAGKLLIIGGNKQGFASVASAYQNARQAGAGEIKIILPDSLRHLPVIQTIAECVLAKSTKTGVLGLDAWPDILGALSWSDWLLLPGDLGHNHETIQLLQKLVTATTPLFIASSVLDLVLPDIATLAKRPSTVIECSFGNLQKLAVGLKYTTALTSTMGFVQLVDNLHQMTSGLDICILTDFGGSYIVAQNGRISTTKLDQTGHNIAHSAVYAMQNSNKLFEALTQSVLPSK